MSGKKGNISGDNIDLKPMYAQGFFHVCIRGGVGQYIVFRYYDRTGYYHKLFSNKPELISEEKNILKENMQSLLDEELVYINDRRTRPVVVSVNIESPSEKEALFTFIINFRAILRQGLNYYLNIYEETIAEYDYSVTWLFPQGAKIVKTELGVPVVIDGDRVLSFYVKKGLKVGGRERIEFMLP